MMTNRISKLHINAAKATLLTFLTTDIVATRTDWDGDTFTFTDVPTHALLMAFDNVTQRHFPALFNKADTDAKKIAMAAVLRSMTVNMDDGTVDFAPITRDIINGAIGGVKAGFAMVHVNDPSNRDFKDFHVDIK